MTAERARATDAAHKVVAVTNDVAVVIVTYNSAAVVGTLLDSLPAALDGLTWQTVVVDNGSTDDTVETVLAYPGVHLVRSSNRGYAAGINLGVTEADPADAVLVLNPDVTLDPGAGRALVEEQRTSGAAIVAPLVRELDGSVSTSLRREPSIARNLGLGRTGRPALSEFVTAAEDYDHAHDVDWAVGAVLLVSRECHTALGGWDESYFLYSEETDFCLRARDLGYRTRYTPRAGSMHIGGASGQSQLTHAMESTNRVRLYRRRHGVVASTAYLALQVASELSWWVRGNPHAPAAVRALLVPSRRPAQLGVSDRLLPR